MTLLGIDVSHWQGSVDFAAVRRAGYSFAILKATDGILSDPTFAANRAKARAAGITVGAYHFAEGGDPNAEADNFCRVVGTLAVGDLIVLDWETKAGNPVLWCKTWLDRVAANMGVRPLIYMNQSTLAGFNWAPVVAGNYGLWLAAYDYSPTAIPSSGKWPNVAIKQFSDKAAVPGVAGGCDADVFFGDAAALAAFGFQGADMPTPQEIAAAVWAFNVAGKGVQAQDRLYGIDAVQLPEIKKAIGAPPAPVNVDAGAVAAALAGNSTFLSALAKAVNDDAAARLKS